jgi:hypothetical protein
MLCLNPCDGIAPQDIAVEVVLPPPSGVGLDPAGEAFWTEATMDKPFVEVGALLSEQCRLCDQ